MNYRLRLVFLFLLAPFFCHAQAINYAPKVLQKDMQKLWHNENIELNELEIPDSMYNDFLLERGKIYRSISNGENMGFAYIGRIYSCRAGGCSLEKDQESSEIDEDYEYFDYYILFNGNLVVEQVRVYNYQATHGHEVGGKGWLKQFIGYNGETKLELGKNVDSISGATISANAITYHVNETSRYLAQLMPIHSYFTKQKK
jgi:hypothetical protein